MTVELGLIRPPVGMNVFVIKIALSIIALWLPRRQTPGGPATTPRRRNNGRR